MSVEPLRRTPLPLEIEDFIFEWAARMYPTYAPTLSVVSKRVQERVERVIYETLFIDLHGYIHGPEMAYASRIVFTLNSRPAEFFAKAVRNLYITEEVPMSVREVALAKCTGVRHLAILEDLPMDSGKFLATSYVLSSLYVEQGILAEIAMQGIEFPNLSLLGIFFSPAIRVPSLHRLPVLKTVHIHFQTFALDSDHPWQSDLLTILSTTAQLNVFWIDIHWYYRASAKDVYNYIHKRSIGRVEIRIRYSHHHLSPFSFLWRWRRRITHCDDNGSKHNEPISELYI